MDNQLASVEFCANNYMVFWDGELYRDGMSHNDAVTLANKLNEEGIEDA